MSKKAGELLWRRMRITLPPATGGEFPIPSITNVDTGVTQLNKAFDDMSLDEPSFGTPSRIQVAPMSPIPAWSSVTHSEPAFDSGTETVHVTFFNHVQSPVTINVLIWDPHSTIGPGEADLYT